MSNYQSREFDNHEASNKFRINYDLLAKIRRVRANSLYTELYERRTMQCLTTRTTVNHHSK